MSIRGIATELYRLIREIEQREAALAKAPFDQRPALEEALRRVKAERNRLRRILDGKKEVEVRRRFSGR